MIESTYDQRQKHPHKFEPNCGSYDGAENDCWWCAGPKSDNVLHPGECEKHRGPDVPFGGHGGHQWRLCIACGRAYVVVSHEHDWNETGRGGPIICGCGEVKQ